MYSLKSNELLRVKTGFVMNGNKYPGKGWGLGVGVRWGYEGMGEGDLKDNADWPIHIWTCLRFPAKPFAA